MAFSLKDLLMGGGLEMAGGMPGPAGLSYPPAPGGGSLMSLLGGQQAAQGSMGSNFRTNMKDILSPEIALPMAAAMMNGRTASDSFSGALALAGQGLGERRKERKADGIKTKTMTLLSAKRPDLAQAVESGILQPGEAYKVYLEGAGGKATDDMREYHVAKEQGFQGSFMDYQIKMKEAGRSQVNVDTGAKLPNGFRWLDPDKQEMGVEPIPGGPATTMPAELAARIGMADSFLGQLPGLKQKIKVGSVTGVWDKTKAAAGIGEQGTTYRQIQSGVDALMRLLTGAGMNATEADQYARRYMPTYTDDYETMGQKLEQLERELLSAKEMATRGRVAAGTAPTSAPTGGIVDFSDYFKGP